jgi:hypothetical protein
LRLLVLLRLLRVLLRLLLRLLRLSLRLLLLRLLLVLRRLSLGLALRLLLGRSATLCLSVATWLMTAPLVLVGERAACEAKTHERRTKQSEQRPCRGGAMEDVHRSLLVAHATRCPGCGAIEVHCAYPLNCSAESPERST